MNVTLSSSGYRVSSISLAVLNAGQAADKAWGVRNESVTT